MTAKLSSSRLGRMFHHPPPQLQNRNPYTWIRRQSLKSLKTIPLIDSSTPLHARVLKTAQDIAYGLVFSDEFTQNGRSFSAGTFLLPSATIIFLSSTSSDHDLIWEAASSIDSSIYDPSQISTKDGSLLVRLDNLHPQVEDWHRGQCTRDHTRESGWSWSWGWHGWMGGFGAKNKECSIFR